MFYFLIFRPNCKNTLKHHSTKSSSAVQIDIAPVQSDACLAQEWNECKQLKPFVRFKNVQKSYDGETLVVKDLNLDIAAGEFCHDAGAVGVWKNNLFDDAGWVETATHGDIELAGRPINNIPPHKRGIERGFQNYALFPHMTVGENLAFPLKLRKMESDVEDKVRKALDMVQMVAFIDRKPAQLSGGQQQRIALTRALVFEPELVLMDEPFGALDKQLREHMQYEIKHIHENLGVTVVYVTHDQSEALTMSNRIAVFDDGIIQQLADPVTLHEKPKMHLLHNLLVKIIGLMAQLYLFQNLLQRSSQMLAEQSKPYLLTMMVKVAGQCCRCGQNVVSCQLKKSSSMSMLEARIEELIYLVITSAVE